MSFSRPSNASTVARLRLPQSPRRAQLPRHFVILGLAVSLAHASAVAAAPSQASEPEPLPPAGSTVGPAPEAPPAMTRAAASARAAESASSGLGVVVRTPPGATEIDAGTFDREGHQIGTSHFELETDDTGMRHLKVAMGVDAGGENIAEAVLAPVLGAIGGANAGSSALRVVKEHAQARNAKGNSLEYLVIDHAARRVSCYPPDRDMTRGKHVDMPEGSDVVNVSIQLLLTPLAVGEVDEMSFHIALCKDGPVLYKMAALRGDTQQLGEREIVEVRYGPDLGPMSWLASRLLPKFSFWFDGRDGAYVGHRMPLHTKGPEVVLVRKGFSPADLGFD